MVERLEHRAMLAISSITHTSSDHFFIDTTQVIGATCNYASFQITNDATPDADLWVKIDSFTGGVVANAPGEDGIAHLGPLAANASGAAFFYLQALTATAAAQGYRIAVYASDPSIGAPPVVLQQTFSFVNVLATKTDNNSKVLTTSYAPATPVLGGTVTLAVTGELGQVANNNEAAFTPACFPSWLANVYELRSTTISITAGANTQTRTDALLFNGLTKDSGANPYTAIYTFRVVGMTSSSVPTSPTQFVGKNTNFDHADFNTIPIVSLPPPVNAITLAKVATPVLLPATGGTADFTLRLTNVSAQPLTVDKLIDTLPLVPAAETYKPGTSKFNGISIGDPLIVGNVLTWSSLFTVPANASIDLTFQGLLPAVPGSYTDSAIGRINNTQIDTTIDTTDNAPATATVDVLGSSDLQIVKTDGTTTYTPGVPKTYTITVTNAGPSAVTAARMQDTIPALASSATWIASFTNGSGTASGSGDIDQLINLGVGGTAVYTLTMGIPSTATAVLTNTATITPPPDRTDPNPANNTSTDVDTAALQADLSITKNDSSATYVPGGTTTYTVVVTNTGPSFVTGATVVDTLSPLITGASWTAAFTGVGSSGTGVGSGSINQTINLAAGGTATYTIIATISPAATTTLSNTATVAAPVGTLDPNLANNTATDIDTATPVVFLTIVKTDGSATYVPGLIVPYTITVSNTGPSNLVGGTLTDVFAASISGATWTAIYTGVGSSGPAIGSGNINATVAIAAGGTAVFTIAAPVSAAATGLLVNTATIVAPVGTTNTNLANNSSTDTDTSAPITDLRIVKTDGTATYTPGSPTVYTITVTNDGPSAVIGATVADAFPAQVGNVTWAAVFTNGSGILGGSGNINQLINLGVGGSVVYTVTANILSTATGNLVNTATVTVPVGTTDPTPSNNTSTDTDLIALRSDLSITKTAGSVTYVPGGTTTYTVVVTNTGPSFVTGATVVDTLSPLITGASWTAAFTGVGSSGTGVGSGSIDQVINLAAGGTATYTIIATISPAATTSLSNTATVAAPVGTLDPNLANNTATDTDTATPVCDVSILKTDGTGTYVPGRTTFYTITVTNGGPSFLSGGRMTDTFPASIAGATWTAIYTDAGGGGPPFGTGNIDVNFNLAPGGTARFTVTAPVNSNATSDLVNTAVVTVPIGTTDPNPGNNSSTDTDTPAPIADLSILKTSGTATYLAGQTTVYTVTIANIGPSDVISAQVLDTLSPLIGSAIWHAVFTNGSGIASGSGGINQLIALASGGTAVYTITASILVSASGNLVNTATIAPPFGTADPNPTNNSATDVDIPLAPRSGLLVTGTDDGRKSTPLVRVLDPATGQVLSQFLAYESTFQGGVRVATADMNRDGIDEIITAPGRGRPGEVRVWTQAGVELVAYRTMAFGRGYRGGVEIALGDVTGDGQDDLVTSMSSGAGRVSVFSVLPLASDPVPNTPYRSFRPFPGPYTGGVNVAVADFGTFVNGVKTSPFPDGKSEVVVGTNAGIAATVRIYELSGMPKVVGSFRTIAPGFTGGVTLSIGQWDADTIPDILVGAGINGKSVVEAYSGSTFTKLARLKAFSSFAKPNAKVYATSLDTNGDGILDRVYAVQGLQSTAGTNGVTVWNRPGNVTSVLPLTSAILPPLRITSMTKRSTLL